MISTNASLICVTNAYALKLPPFKYKSFKFSLVIVSNTPLHKNTTLFLTIPRLWGIRAVK